MKRQTAVFLFLIVCIGLIAWRFDDVRSLLGLSTNETISSIEGDSGPSNTQARTGASRAVAVTTADVEFSPPRDRIQSIGTGRAIQSIQVIADVAGTVEAVHVRPNTDVAAAAPIVTLERETQRILLESAEAELEKQRATFDRFETLINQNSNAISQAQLDEARAALAAANADVAAAQYEFDRRVIRAPFAGQINLNDLTIGTYLPQGSEVVSLVDTTRLLVEFAVPETSVSRIAIGVPVRLSTPAIRGRVFNGTITAFDSTIDAEFRTIRVRAEVENPDNVLIPGMTFNVIIRSADDPMPRIPAIAVLWNQDGAFVWRLTEDGETEEVQVTLRFRDSDDVWVEAELADGDRIVTDGAFKLSPGSPVTVIEDGSA